MPQEERGVIYVTAGEDQYLTEATISARSLKGQHPDLSVALFTDADNVEGPFDHILPLSDPEHSFVDKIRPMAGTPFTKTVYLDTDTYICDDITPLFDLLSRFEIAAAHAPQRVSYDIPGLPDAFPEYNTGVVAFQNSAQVQSFFHEWQRHYDRQRDDETRFGDQAAFRKTAYQTDLAIGTLPAEYNCRFIYPGYVEQQVKILHGRHPELRGMAEVLNRHQGKRVFTGNAHRRVYSYPMPVSISKYPGMSRTRYKAKVFLRHVQEEGFRQSLRTLIGRMRHT